MGTIIKNAPIRTYVIISVTNMGDVCTVTGTVDDIPVTIQTWVSALNPNDPIGTQQFFCTLMLAAAFPPSPQAMPIYTGTIVK